MGTTVEGYRQILGFIEVPPQDISSVQRLFDNLKERGIPTGLFCIPSGEARLAGQIAECLQLGKIQYCQFCKRAHVLSFLGQSDSDRIKSAMIQAYEIPDYEQA